MAKKGTKFRKYSYEYKMQAAEQYLSGKTGGRRLGKKDGVIKGRPKQVKLESLSKDEQIEYLKMENAVLKKLKALRKQNGEH